MTEAHGSVAVVGAGHAGLCVVAALRRVGVTPVVYDDAGRLGDTWRARWDGLRLNTERDLSLVPDTSIDPSVGRWPTATEWADHIESAAQQLGVGGDVGRIAERVVAVERSPGGGWLVRTETATRIHELVVVATGRNRLGVRPEWPGVDDCDIEIVHSSTFRSSAPFVGRRVLVVGGGNSGTEIAHLLAEAGVDTTLSMRSRPVWSKRELFGTTLTRLAVRSRRLPDRMVDVSGRLMQAVLFRGLREAGLAPADHRLSQVAHASGATLDSGFVDDVRSGRVAVVAGVDRFDRASVVLDDGSRIEVDVVVAATGFRPGLDDILPAELVRDGWPIVTESPFEQAPGLFTAGLNPARLTAFHPDFITEGAEIATAVTDRLGAR